MTELLEMWDVLLNHSDDDPAGVYSSKILGHRCLYNTRWVSGSGLIEPEKLLSAKKMDDKQIKASLADFAALGSWACAMVLLDARSRDKTLWREDAEKAVKVARGKDYNEYYAHWDPVDPEKIMGIIVYRPGWGPPPVPGEEKPPVAPREPVWEMKPTMPRPPKHPGAFRSANEITAQHYAKHDQRLAEYKVQLDEWARSVEKYNTKSVKVERENKYRNELKQYKKDLDLYKIELAEYEKRQWVPE